jgi:hypothetical protein
MRDGMTILAHKRRARLNILRHLLNSIPYEKTSPRKIELPKRKIDEALGIDIAPMLIPEPF